MIKGRKRIGKGRFSALLSLLLAVAGSAAFADGHIFIWRNEKVDVFQPSQKALIYFDGTSETLTLQTKYEGPAEKMVWLVPVPSKPTVRKGKSQVFVTMSKRMQEPDVAYTRFRGTALGGKEEAPVLAWRRRIGRYDVALLSPVGAASVLQWLKTNEYGVPPKAVPILEDYVDRKWWIVASKVHPAALTVATRERLTSGTLHPLEINFQTRRCVYPMRLTSLAAGPVEVLLYIAGERHWEPDTLAGPQWQIDFRSQPSYKNDPSARWGRVEDLDVPPRCTTKLRRVFRPEEMTDDVYFRPADLAKHFATTDTVRSAVVATQWGRLRLAEGIPHLTAMLEAELPKLGAARNPLAYRRPDDLPPDPHVRSALWALGRIGSARSGNPAIEKVLVSYSNCQRTFIQREAWKALETCKSARCGPVLLKHLETYLGPAPPRNSLHAMLGGDYTSPYSELYLITQWLDANATGSVREQYVGIVLSALKQNKRGWAVNRAMVLRDSRFIPHLEDHVAAQAACGHEPAIEKIVEALIQKQNDVEALASETGGYTRVEAQFDVNEKNAVRTEIRHRTPYDEGYRLGRSKHFEVPGFMHRNGQEPLPADARARAVRKAVKDPKLSDFYCLYLFSWMEQPTPEDIALWRTIWRAEDDPDETRKAKRLMAADVMYRWKRNDVLASTVPQCKDREVRDAVVWGLAKLEASEAAEYVEKDIRTRWDDYFKRSESLIKNSALGRTGLRRPGDKAHNLIGGDAYRDFLRSPAGRASYKRLCSDRNLHPRTRYTLLTDFQVKEDWKQPLMSEVATALAAGSSYREFRDMAFSIGLNRGSDALIALWSDDLDTSRQIAILHGLMVTRSEKGMPVFERAYAKVWPQRFLDKDESAVLTKGIGGLYQTREYAGNHDDFLDLLLTQIHDESVHADYRAVLLRSLLEGARIQAPWGPDRFLAEIHDLLEDQISQANRQYLVKKLREVEMATFRTWLASGSSSAMAGIERLFKDVWSKRYKETEGKALPFTETWGLFLDTGRVPEKHEALGRILEPMVSDESLEPGYRAFVACCCPRSVQAKMIPLMKELAMTSGLPAGRQRAIDMVIQQVEQHIRMENMQKNRPIPPSPPAP